MRIGPISFRGFARAVGAPHLFEIVELADVGAKDMHDRVPRVEEHPVAERHTLDLRGRIAGVATGLDDPVGDRADMNIRAAGGDDHPVGERRFARKLDRDDVFGLGVFEGVDDDLGERIDCPVANNWIAALRRSSRFGTRRGCQGRVPLGAMAIRMRPAVKMRRPRAVFKPVRASASFRAEHSRREAAGMLGEGWLRGQDLNLRPSGYEPDELPGCSTPR